ncbi:hypothetical protein [Salinibacter altiplanensis]|uniref:hypothetical protein n=1 Tax=Salinibacter altiplanensis TaxID=1803181 RepID=UPI000C9EF3CE|nr:hypothetical protein [Salinibacter altiplanensis]
MTDAPPTDETVVLATYANRQDAEMARARLAEHEIDAVVVADDVHPPFQLAEGVELRGLEDVADPARRAFGEETHVSVEDGVPAAMPSESAQQRDRAALTFGRGGLVQATGPPPGPTWRDFSSWWRLSWPDCPSACSVPTGALSSTGTGIGRVEAAPGPLHSATVPPTASSSGTP